MTVSKVWVKPPKRFASAGLERLLLQLRIIQPHLIPSLLAESPKKKILATLAEKKLISQEQDVMKQLAKESLLEYVDVVPLEHSSSPSIACLLDYDFILDHRALPIAVDNGVLKVAMCDPFDEQVIELISKRLGMPVKASFAVEDSIVRAAAPFVTNMFCEETLSSQLASLDKQFVKDPQSKAFALEWCFAHPNIAAFWNFLLSILEKYSNETLEIILFPEKTELSLTNPSGTKRQLACCSAQLGQIIVTHWKHRVFGVTVPVQTKETYSNWCNSSLLFVETIFEETSSPEPAQSVTIQTVYPSVSHLENFNLAIPEDVSDKIKTDLTNLSRAIFMIGRENLGATAVYHQMLNATLDQGIPICSLEERITSTLPGVHQYSIQPTGSQSFSHLLKTCLELPQCYICINRIRTTNELTRLLEIESATHPVFALIDTDSYEKFYNQLKATELTSERIAKQLGSVLEQHFVALACADCKCPLSLQALGEAEEYFEQLDPAFLTKDVLSNLQGNAGCAACGYSGSIGGKILLSHLKVSSDLEAYIANGCTAEEFAGVARRLSTPALRKQTLDLLCNGFISFQEFKRINPVFIKQLDQLSLENNTTSVETLPSQVLPVSATPNTEPPSKGRSPSAAINTRSGVKKKTVLIIDDDSDVRAMMRLVLENEFYRVEEAEDGLSGLESVYLEPPDLVLCDLAMPRLNGKEFVQRVRSEKEIAHLPILMFTAFSDEETEVELLSSGADDFVPKTAGAEKIIARVRRLLNR